MLASSYLALPKEMERFIKEPMNAGIVISIFLMFPGQCIRNVPGSKLSIVEMNYQKERL
jgi:hypothetical protein